MKLLWVLIIAVVAAGVTLAVLPARSPAPAPVPGEPRRSRAAEKAPAVVPSAAPSPAPAPTPAPSAPAAAETPAPPSVPPPTPVPAAPAAIPAPAEDAAPATGAKADAAKPAESKPAPDKPKESASPETPAAAASGIPSSASPGAEVFVIPDHPVFNGEKVMPSKAERRPDGTVILDGRFGIKGSGTQADPYRISWDLLLSAHETYKPRMGQTRIPQRIVMLDGKHVTITGFTAFPLTATDPKDMLVMLNQWDGCCIGVPPTPYDAIEVKLAGNPTEKMKAADHGIMTGRFKLDPYEDGGWLLGLYLIEDAKFDPGKEGGAPDALLP